MSKTTNPFESNDLDYIVLKNNIGEYSLWPHFSEVPDGWTVVLGPSDRDACLSYIEQHWADLGLRRDLQPSPEAAERRVPAQRGRV